jgi:hypothetical protein
MAACEAFQLAALSEDVESAPAQLERDAICKQFSALPQQPVTTEVDDRSGIGTLIQGERL